MCGNGAFTCENQHIVQVMVLHLTAEDSRHYRIPAPAPKGDSVVMTNPNHTA